MINKINSEEIEIVETYEDRKNFRKSDILEEIARLQKLLKEFD